MKSRLMSGAVLVVLLSAAVAFAEDEKPWKVNTIEWLSTLTVDQAKEYIAQNQFAKGSMLPKVEAAIRFAESGEGRSALITLLDKAKEGIEGKTGTVICS